MSVPPHQSLRTTSAHASCSTRPFRPSRCASTLLVGFVAAASSIGAMASPSWSDPIVVAQAAPQTVSPASGSGAGQSGAAVNSVETILDDMRLRNDGPIAGVPQTPGWSSGPGQVVMGADPRGSATPWWWTPYDRSLKSANWWRAFVPWMVVFDGVDNRASNTRVEMRALRAYVRSRATGRWTSVVEGSVEGSVYPRDLRGVSDRTAAIASMSDGVRSLKPPRDGFFHGWTCCGKIEFDPTDVAAVHVTMEARLAVDDAARGDDRDAAFYMIHVGADYYPTATTPISAFAPTGYNPGVGMSRAKRIRNDWQPISFTTVNVGETQANGSAMSEQELRAAPPPMR